MDFPTRLKELRLERKLTQEELGSKVNVTKVSISGYESGNRKPDIDTLERLSSYFGVIVDYLLGKTDYRTIEEISDEKAVNRAYYGGGDNWTEEEKRKADGKFKAIRDKRRAAIHFTDGFKIDLTPEEEKHLEEQLRMYRALKGQEKK